MGAARVHDEQAEHAQCSDFFANTYLLSPTPVTRVLTGELREYVTSELNVRELETCADPQRYASVRAEPDWAALGKKLGKGGWLARGWSGWGGGSVRDEPI